MSCLYWYIYVLLYLVLLCIFSLEVPESKLRWIVASFLPDEEGSGTEKRLTSEGYKLYEFPQIERAVITDFPFKNMISILLAVWTVYPLLKQFFKVSVGGCRRVAGHGWYKC